MQTGAFIQILLVLAAISARMNAIAQEHLEIIDGLILAIQNLKKGIIVTVTLSQLTRLLCAIVTSLANRNLLLPWRCYSSLHMSSQQGH